MYIYICITNVMGVHTM